MAAMSRLTHFVKDQKGDTLVDWAVLVTGAVMLTVAVVLTLSGNEDHRVSNTVERMGAPQISPSDST